MANKNHKSQKMTEEQKQAKLKAAQERQRRMDAKKEDGTVELTVPTSGVYLVKIGDLPARRVVVIR